jgi:hypothetical protein
MEHNPWEADSVLSLSWNSPPFTEADGLLSCSQGPGKCVRCHHGTERPQIADGEDGLQIRREAANILSKQSQRANRGWRRQPLRCFAVQSRRSWTTFQRCLLPPSSGRFYTRLHSAISQKAVTFKLAAVKTWNITKWSGGGSSARGLCGGTRNASP